MSSFDGLIPLQQRALREALGDRPQGPQNDTGPEFQGLLEQAFERAQQAGGLEGVGGVSSSTESSIGDAIRGAIDAVSDRRGEVKDKVNALASGEPVELHDLMVAMGKSEVSFNLMLEVRNKFVDAWRELNRSVV